MFENTLLIIKSDFFSSRKCLLLHLLSKGFQIQGRRKLAFTPEDAGEFYRDLADDKCYMLYVIMLAKGTSEAFILRKNNAAEELLHTMICYFGSSMEMDRNVHVSRNVNEARREITFIFPNYIHEPIEVFDKQRFARQSVIAPLLRQTYDIIKKPTEDKHANWRYELSDWLLQKNAIYPQISNQCSHSPNIALQDKYQQTDGPCPKEVKETGADRASIGSISTMPGVTSDLMSSTSCVSCTSFKSVQPCGDKSELDEFERRLEARAKKTMDESICFKEEVKIVCAEQMEWTHICEESSASVETIEKVVVEEEILIFKEQLQVAPATSWASLVPEKMPVGEAIVEEVPTAKVEAEVPPPAEGEIIISEATEVEDVKKDKEKDKEKGEEVGLPKIESAAEPAEGPILESEPPTEIETELPVEQTTEVPTEIPTEPATAAEEAEAPTAE